MSKVKARSVNTNPLQFEEFATSMASLSGYYRDGNGGFDLPLDRLDQLFAKARKQPLGYRDVSDLTGQSQNSVDERAGRAAWLLQHTDALNVFGVHSLVCHNVGQRFQTPLIEQLAIALQSPARLSDEKLQANGRDGDWLDIVGVKDDAIWLVQAVYEKSLLDSAVQRSGTNSGSLFKSRVFADRILAHEAVASLCVARNLVREAFPENELFTMAVVLHPEGPDFELYQLVLGDKDDRVELTADLVVRNSIDFSDMIAEDHELLWSVAERHDRDPLFHGIPPCRGGRSLNILAAVAQAQLASDELIEFRQKDIADLLERHFRFDVTRDKIRHDLEDRLVSQGLMRKWGNVYFLTIRGVARYFYFLAKYSETSVGDAMSVVDACSKQRDLIVNRFGYVV